MLDIGCKFGDLLVAADRRGWNASGVELNSEFCKDAKSRGFEVYNDVIERLDSSISGFDVIVMSHVLEHIERPDDTLKTIKGQVRRGLFSIINRLGHGDMVGILAQKPY